MMQSQLATLTKVAAKIVLNPKRMETFMKLLNSKDGAVQAALSVVAAVDQLSKVPPEIQPQLAVNAYMLMVEVAQAATGMKPDPKIMTEVIRSILTATGGPKNAVERTAQPPAPAPAQPQPENVMQRMGVGVAA